ncbi:MAG: 50S ribosomal protein L32 [Candidatus Magasanikbacteria bacterium]|nr:50S ribosomal protein L32 [Candidatus Magasanikbacteria bacterium]
MGLPSKRRTARSKRERNAHAALKLVGTTRCSACGKETLPHRACPHCGTYRGRKLRS